MNRRSIIRWLTLGLAITAVAATAAVLPAFGSNDEDAMRLHLNSDARQFTGSGTTQDVKTGSRGCEIDPTEGPLVTLSAKSGIVGNSIGVKSGGSNANGTPCAQISGPSETLVITRNALSLTPDWRALRLDLELKGNAWTHVTVKKGSQSRTFQLVTGSSIAAYNVQLDPDVTPALAPVTPAPGPLYMATSTVAAPDAACANLSDSGPDSGANDNCQWSIDPGMLFDVVEITTSVGTATLEGGGDFGPGTANDTLFFYNRSPLICPGETITVPPEVEGGTVTGSFTFLTTDAACKPFDAEAVEQDGTVLFQPTGVDKVEYRAFIELGGKDAPLVGSQAGFKLFLEYDPEGVGGLDFKPVPWCQDMVFGETVSSVDIPLIGWLGNSVNAITSATIPGIADGESWCIAAAYTRDVGGELVTTWQLYGEDDPKFQ